MKDYQFEKAIQESANILIIAAIPVDFDSIGSGLILKKYIESKGKDVIVITSTYPSAIIKEQLSFFPYFDEVSFQDTTTLLAEQSFDTIILVDGANKIQFYNPNQEEPDFSKAKHIIHIDHHLYAPEELGTYTIRNPQAACTCEVLINSIIPDDFIDKNIATLGYAGIIGDTGNFKWNFYPSTLHMAGFLLSKGADISGLISHVYYAKDKTYFDTLAWITKQISYDNTIHSLFLSLSPDVTREENINSEKFSAIKEIFFDNIAKFLKEYPRGFLIRSISENETYISVRANEFENTINMPDLFKALGGNGGGHFNAASTTMHIPFEDAKSLLIKTLHEQIDDNR